MEKRARIWGFGAVLERFLSQISCFGAVLAIWRFSLTCTPKMTVWRPIPESTTAYLGFGPDLGSGLGPGGIWGQIWDLGQIWGKPAALLPEPTFANIG